MHRLTLAVVLFIASIPTLAQDKLIVRVVDVAAGLCCVVKIPGDENGHHYIVYDAGNYQNDREYALKAVKSETTEQRGLRCPRCGCGQQRIRQVRLVDAHDTGALAAGPVRAVNAFVAPWLHRNAEAGCLTHCIGPVATVSPRAKRRGHPHSAA